MLKIFGWLSILGSLFGVLNVIRHLLFRLPKLKRDLNFDNYPFVFKDEGSGLQEALMFMDGETCVRPAWLAALCNRHGFLSPDLPTSVPRSEAQ